MDVILTERQTYNVHIPHSQTQVTVTMRILQHVSMDSTAYMYLPANHVNPFTIKEPCMKGTFTDLGRLYGWILILTS